MGDAADDCFDAGLRDITRVEPNDDPCRWYALCDNPATGTYPHPILGDVPICDRCREKTESLSKFAPRDETEEDFDTYVKKGAPF